jgi:hypothetical protein
MYHCSNKHLKIQRSHARSAKLKIVTKAQVGHVLLIHNGSSKTRRKFLPDNLKTKAAKFKVLIPEYNLTNPKHRTDFRLIFDDNTPDQNIEVEWTTSRFKHGKQTEQIALTHYAKGKGFFVVLQDDKNHGQLYLQRIESIPIDGKEFFWWFAKRAPRLLGATTHE